MKLESTHETSVPLSSDKQHSYSADCICRTNPADKVNVVNSYAAITLLFCAWNPLDHCVPYSFKVPLRKVLKEMISKTQFECIFPEANICDGQHAPALGNCRLM